MRSPSVAVADSHTSGDNVCGERLAIDDRFNFDLFAGVAVAEVRQRLATTGTDLGVLRQVDQFLAVGQVRVVPSLRSGAARLLSAFLLGSRLILRIISDD